MLGGVRRHRPRGDPHRTAPERRLAPDHRLVRADGPARTGGPPVKQDDTGGREPTLQPACGPCAGRYLRVMARPILEADHCRDAIRNAPPTQRRCLAHRRIRARCGPLLRLDRRLRRPVEMLDRHAGRRDPPGRRGRPAVPRLRVLVLAAPVHRVAAMGRELGRAAVGRPWPRRPSVRRVAERAEMRRAADRRAVVQRRSPNSPRRSLGGGSPVASVVAATGPSTISARSRSRSAACERGAPRITGFPSLTAFR